MPACIQQYRRFHYLPTIALEGGCFVVVVVLQSSMRSCTSAQRKNSHACFASVAPGSPQALLCIFAVRTNSNAVVQSNDLQGEAEGGKDTDGEEASAVGAGHVQSRCGAGSGGGRGGLA
jgi:hypothetical protein